MRLERRTGRSNLSESRSRSVAIIFFAITTIAYTRTDLRGPRGERGPRLRPRDFQLAGIPTTPYQETRSGLNALSRGWVRRNCAVSSKRLIARIFPAFRFARERELGATLEGSSHPSCAVFGKKTKGCFSSKARFSAVVNFRALVRKSSLPIVYTGFVQRGLQRSSPKNVAAPLYERAQTASFPPSDVAAVPRTSRVTRQPNSAGGAQSDDPAQRCRRTSRRPVHGTRPTRENTPWHVLELPGWVQAWWLHSLTRHARTQMVVRAVSFFGPE